MVACSGRGSASFTGTHNQYDTPHSAGSDSPCSLGGFGACVADGQCAPGDGHVSSVQCTPPRDVCCAPLDRCTGAEDFVCCDADKKEHRPVCDAPSGATVTTLTCPFDQVQAAPGQCATSDAGASCEPKGAFCSPTASQCCSGLTCAPARVPADGGAPTPAECQ